MKRTVLGCFLLFGLLAGWSVVHADNFFVIPVKKCCTCKGTMVGTRWCDNGDGTVTDMLGYNGKGKCLVWLKDANCFAQKYWFNCTTGPNPSCDDAQVSCGTLHDGECGLTDGSSAGDWRLPTRWELLGLRAGTEPISSDNPRAFTNVVKWFYWSSTTSSSDPYLAYGIYFYGSPTASGYGKDAASGVPLYVLPVRDAKW